jgi:hypothetical protein
MPVVETLLIVVSAIKVFDKVGNFVGKLVDGASEHARTKASQTSSSLITTILMGGN